jgi:endonuclease III
MWIRPRRINSSPNTGAATQQITNILDALEALYGNQPLLAPADPYEFLVWWHCGYPASEERCSKGWKSLVGQIGTTPENLLSASTTKLARVLKAGGMVPELRATRLQEIAQRTMSEFAGDLRLALTQLSAAQARKVLKTFPGIGNPGADRILLFAQLASIAAVPSSCPHVLVRVRTGPESDNYAATYAEAQRMLEALPATCDARIRAYLLISRHARQLCKRSKPLCNRCPLAPQCAFGRTRSVT